jgi:thiol:disulfide interchange protein
MRVAPIALVVALLACGKARKDPAPPLVFYSLEEGEAAARRRHELALVFFGADWSTADKELEYSTFPDPEVREAMRDWIAIKVDMTDDEAPGLREKLDRFKVIGDPSTILVDFDDPGGGELLRFNEYVKPMTMASAIRAAAARARSRRAEAR